MAPNRWIAAAAGAVLVLVSGCTGGGGDDSDASATQNQTSAPGQSAGGQGYADLVDRVEPSVVTVRVQGGVGSGVVFKPDVVITNHHVVQGQDQVRVVYADGTESAASVIATDQVTDIAVLRTERGGLPVPEYREQLPRQGDRAIAIGSPLGFQNTVTAGIISGLHREIPGSAGRTQSLVDLIQTDAPISPGSSGGALLDAQGRVIGINEAYIPPSTGAVALGFAIPSATAVDTANELLQDGTATHPYLGVSLGRLTPPIREQFNVQVEQGALVLGVEEGGPAAQAGLRQGDVIVGLGQQDVNTVEDVLSVLRRAEPDQQLQLTYSRDGNERQTTVTVGTRPS
ncbi:S1-C subfamily serine protease [Prauserella shujinwangii]|uniref:S1-C subfamily serine protease n=1 Tax=Prauserella shujinwangii TaxID=1453103 RepID=A0A2T0LL65_9PSEU|nr:trypsin-like peptidase domain-containing protein [Prauserella shujinwangii]PRX43688.1 S1-C subfamily serine protease [Prauserella shujinwangii]